MQAMVWGKRGARAMARGLGALAFMSLGLLAAPAAAQRLPGDAAIIDGFEAVVFGAEITGPLSDSTYLKKFAGPVHYRIENLAATDRRASVRAFMRQIGRQIGGLETVEARGGEAANFVIHVVDRREYARVGREVYRNPFLRVPGNCVVRATYARAGITRSDAIVVSDEGDALFRRCLIEEVLQGLGPLNDNADAPDSVFNDTSKLTSFGPYDRVLMNMLYDARLAPGMSQAEAAPLLPAILRDARRRVRG